MHVLIVTHFIKRSSPATRKHLVVWEPTWPRGGVFSLRSPGLEFVVSGGQCHLIHLTNLSPVNTKHLYNIYAMLDQRRRRWADFVGLSRFS